MFYCETCGNKRGWPTDFYLPMSHGKCEVCDHIAGCFDVPSKNLPTPRTNEPDPQDVKDAIASIEKELE